MIFKSSVNYNGERCHSPVHRVFEIDRSDFVLSCMTFRHSIVWLRRDLRLMDHTALEHALRVSQTVSLLFIFDTDLLEGLPRDDRRLTFIWQSLDDIRRRLPNPDALHLVKGRPTDLWTSIVSALSPDAVFFHHDYEPYAIQRDAHVRTLLSDMGVHCETFKDQVMFEKDEILTNDGKPFKVFTAYKNRWIGQLQDHPPSPSSSPPDLLRISAPHIPGRVSSLDAIGFLPVIDNVIQGGETEALKKWNVFLQSTCRQYDVERDRPDHAGTSRLSPCLRFGNLSIRAMVHDLLGRRDTGSQTFLSELIWREFFMMILHHFPQVTHQTFRPQAERIRWLNSPQWFDAWKKGETGFPIVDAGMRELNQTGLMHNRLRMITASFLVKHLHVDWRWGEQYFAEKLLDYELSSNNGNWQWVAGTGADAAPFFRVFNPLTQSKKFDPDGVYIRKWIPELDSVNATFLHEPGAGGRHIPPLIDLTTERNVCLTLYRS